MDKANEIIRVYNNLLSVVDDNFDELQDVLESGQLESIIDQDILDQLLNMSQM